MSSSKDIAIRCRCEWYSPETTATGRRSRRCLRYAPAHNYWLGKFYCTEHFDLALIEQGTTDDYEEWLRRHGAKSDIA